MNINVLRIPIARVPIRNELRLQLLNRDSQITPGGTASYALIIHCKLLADGFHEVLITLF